MKSRQRAKTLFEQFNALPQKKLQNGEYRNQHGVLFFIKPFPNPQHKESPEKDHLFAAFTHKLITYCLLFEEDYPCKSRLEKIDIDSLDVLKQDCAFFWMSCNGYFFSPGVISSAESQKNGTVDGVLANTHSFTWRDLLLFDKNAYSKHQHHNEMVLQESIRDGIDWTQLLY